MGTTWEGVSSYSGPNHMFTEDAKEIFRKFRLFSPIDWIYRTSHSIKLESEMIPWLENNCLGSWKLVGWILSRNATIQFSRLEDAMAFKLRWL